VGRTGFGVKVYDHHIGSLPCKRPADGSSQPGARARHDHRLARELALLHPFLSPMKEKRKSKKKCEFPGWTSRQPDKGSRH
jgi:hypothetical protein